MTSLRVCGCLLGSRVTPELCSPCHWVQPPKQHRSGSRSRERGTETCQSNLPPLSWGSWRDWEWSSWKRSSAQVFPPGGICMTLVGRTGARLYHLVRERESNSPALSSQWMPDSLPGALPTSHTRGHDPKMRTKPHTTHTRRHNRDSNNGSASSGGKLQSHFHSADFTSPLDLSVRVRSKSVPSPRATRAPGRSKRGPWDLSKGRVDKRK